MTTVNNPLGEKKWMTVASSLVVTDSKRIPIAHPLFDAIALNIASLLRMLCRGDRSCRRKPAYLEMTIAHLNNYRNKIL